MWKNTVQEHCMSACQKYMKNVIHMGMLCDVSVEGYETFGQ